VSEDDGVMEDDSEEESRELPVYLLDQILYHFGHQKDLGPARSLPGQATADWLPRHLFKTRRHPARVGEHRIDTGDATPVKQRPYQMSKEAHRVVQCECSDMLIAEEMSDKTKQ
jgi:hypothetical protein